MDFWKDNVTYIMEFHEKLQELRRGRGLTQEELAEAIFVSRTAISKWESGRGYPSIDSLKAIAGFFSVSIDALLSGEEVLSIAEEDGKEKAAHFRNSVFGLMDCSVFILLFLPVFAEEAGGMVKAVSLVHLNEMAPYLKFAFWMAVIGMTAQGIIRLALRRGCREKGLRYWDMLSWGFHVLCVLLFIVSKQPYAATLLFLFLAMKMLIQINRP
jgi:transcriptional regulator with XRE-family HTH domain